MHSIEARAGPPPPSSMHIRNTFSLKPESELATSRPSAPNSDTLLEVLGEIGESGAFPPPDLARIP